MAKKQASAAPRKSAAEVPEFVTYTQRKINRQTWARFKQRANEEGHPAVWLFDKFIAAYGNGEKVF